MESEGGITLLRQLIEHPDPPMHVKDLAAIVINNCAQFHSAGELTENDATLDG